MRGDFSYDDALRRIRLLAVAVGIMGTAAVLVAQDVRAASGFLLGAALSLLSFEGLSSLAHAIGGAKRPGLLAAVLIGLRYVVIGCALYVIVKILGFTAGAVLAGLLASFGAVILEILYELIFLAH